MIIDFLEIVVLRFSTKLEKPKPQGFELHLFVFVNSYLQFFSFFFGNSSHMLSTNSHRNCRLSTSSTRISFFAPSYGGSISASGISFTATGTGFTKSLSMHTNTLLRINILRHCIDFIYLIQTYFLPKQMSHQYYGFRLLLLH